MNMRYWSFIGMIIVVAVIVLAAQNHMSKLDPFDMEAANHSDIPVLEVPELDVTGGGDASETEMESRKETKTDSVTETETKTETETETETETVTQTDGIGLDFGATGSDNNQEDDSLVSEEEPNSYETWIHEADKQIAQLQASCEGSLLNLYVQYMSAKAKAEKRELIADGKAELALCDSSFDRIMNNLETTLTSNEFPTTIINTYREEYTKKKAFAQSLLD